MLTLRPLGQTDVALFQKWLYTPHVAKWYEDPQDWLEEVDKREDEFDWLHHFIAIADDQPIGFCQYYEYCRSGETWHGDTEISGTYSIDYLIGEPAYLGQGLGRRMIQALLEKIRLEESAKRVIALPDPENQASCGTLLSCGFVYDAAHQFYTLEL